MKILALDASSNIASLAIVEVTTTQKKILYRYDLPHERCDSSVFFTGLKESIEINGIPDRIVIGLGPGSYNGLRSSIAAAQGMASALNIDLIGIPSPLAMATDCSSFWVCGDARGGHYWLASVVENHFIQAPFLLAPSAIEEHLATHPDFPLLVSTVLNQLPSSQKTIITTPNTVLLATLGQHAVPLPTIPEPLYLKSPHITQKIHS